MDVKKHSIKSCHHTVKGFEDSRRQPAKSSHKTCTLASKILCAKMKLSLSALLFALLSSNSDASSKQDNHIRASFDKLFTPPEIPFQKSWKGAGDVESVHLDRRAMQETVSYSDMATAGGTERARQRAKNEEQKALTEEKTTGLHSTGDEAGAYVVTPKLEHNKSDEATLSDNQVETRIVGGEQSTVGEFPYYVDMLGCGGTLIAPNVVLSAAHCGGAIGDEVFVSGYKYGTNQFGAIGVTVVAQVRHPNYNANTMENDFYLYKLDRNVYPVTQVTLTLNQDATKPVVGSDLTTLGLGLLSSGGSTAPEFLNDVVVQTVSNQFCGSIQSYGSGFRPNVMLCAGAPGKDACQGDSGGPIVMRNGNNHVLVGVVSWGYDCAYTNYPGIYARVSSAMSWIKSVACDQWRSNGSFCALAAPTLAPVAPTRAPVVPTRTPVAPTRAPVAPTRAPVVPTRAPIAPTRAPVVPTRAPVAPTRAPVAPTRAPVAPTLPPQPIGGCTTLTLEFQTDSWPEETLVALQSDGGGLIWDYGNFEANTVYSFAACIPVNACTVLDITDTEGDGLLDDGYMTVIWGTEVLYDDWRIGYGFFMDLGDAC